MLVYLNDHNYINLYLHNMSHNPNSDLPHSVDKVLMNECNLIDVHMQYVLYNIL
jgi:hypothetical protein